MNCNTTHQLLSDMPSVAGRQWKAKLKLRFERRNSRTVLVQRQHLGPLYVQKPFYPEGNEVCHTYLLHPPAGIVGGDKLDINVCVEQHAHALVTTPAATKFYRTNSDVGSLSQSIDVREDAIMEWLPNDNILFNGARAKIKTRINLEKRSRLIAWDSLCLGRPACVEDFVQGSCRQRFEVWMHGSPLLIDALHIGANSDIYSANWGLKDCPISGLFVVYPGTVELLSLLNSKIERLLDVHCAASLVDSILVVRCLADDNEAIQDVWRQLWELARPLLLDKIACPPRIWST